MLCGKGFDFLPTHLQRTHGVTAEEYRQEFQIPAGQPLCSEAYSQAHRAKIQRMQVTGVLTYDHLPRATSEARAAGRGERTSADLRAQAARAKQIRHKQLQPGARRADGRDADRAREYQRNYRAKKR